MTSVRAVWAASALYAIVYGMLGWDRYATYHSGSDVGLFTQTIASAFGGFANTTEAGSHFTFHFSPILFMLAPLLLAAHSSLVLVGLQAIAGALAAPPLFLIARKRLPERVALALAVIALLYPPLAGVVFADFHENVLAPALTLWLLWGLDARRFALAALFLVLLLGVKEDQATILGFAALVGLAWYARKRDRAGMAFAAAGFAVSVAVFVGFFEFVRPLAGAHDVWGPTHFYTWSRIVDPRGSAPWWSIGRPAYFLEALVPLAFLPLGSPAFVLALPGFAEVLGSHESITYTMGQHYAAIWIPYVLFAHALALAGLHARSPRAAVGFVRTSLGLCVIVLLFASPTHWGHYLRVPSANDAALSWLLAHFGDASIGAPDEIYAHLGFDPNASLGLERRPPLAIVDTRHTDSALGNAMRVRLRAHDSAYRLFWHRDGIELYVRRYHGPISV